VFWKVLQHFPKFNSSLKKPPHIRRISPAFLCYEDKEIQPHAIQCSSNSSESVMVTRVSIRIWHMCKGSTAADGSRSLWTRRKFRIRILRGLIVLTFEVITNLVMCSGRNFNTGEDSSIWSMCRCTRQFRARRKLRWTGDMIGTLIKYCVPHNI